MTDNQQATSKATVSLNPADWPDHLPPCLIYVDKDGRFWHLGAEMTHAGINSLITQNVEIDDQGRYVVSFSGQRCFVEVEDTFFVVTRVDAPLEDANGVRWQVTLNDGTAEFLDPATLSQNAENVLYTKVKAARFPARFLRNAYYQLAEFIEEVDSRYVLKAGRFEYPLT